MRMTRRSILLSSLLPFWGTLALKVTGQKRLASVSSGPLNNFATSTQVETIPKEDIRLRAELTDELIAYKKDFRLPEWAKPGRARQIRFDGGPMFAACQFESGWKYLTDPATPGFVGMIKSVWTLTNLYTNDIERRLDEIRAAGYNWIWASYQLGYAMDDEARQRAQVRRLIDLAHARGMQVTAYFSLTSVFTTSAFIGNPESKNWIQEHADGTPVAYSGIPVRLMACVNKPGRIEYFKKIVRMAVDDGADDIFWDSIFNRCYCSHCEKGFADYSQRVLGKSQSIPRSKGSDDKKKFGIEENFDLLGLTNSSVEGLFAEYNHYAAAKAIADLDRYAKSFNPEILVSANSHRFRYIDHVADLVWCEDSNGKGGRIDEQGKLTTPIGIYAWCQATAGGKETAQLTVAPHEYWQLQKPEYYKLTIAEAASFQSSFVMLAGYAFSVRFDDGDIVAKRAWNGISAGLNFIERNQRLFEDARSVADVALYYSHTTRIRPAPESRERGELWQAAAQAFFLAGIPLRVVTDESAVLRGAKGLLSDTRMIVVPSMSSLSDEELALLREYVNLGGTLMVTSDSGAYTSFWTKRMNAPWVKESAGVKIVDWSELTSPNRIRTVAQGLLKRPPLITVAGNGYQLVNPTAQAERLVLHVLNYDMIHPIKNLKVTISTSGYIQAAALMKRESTVQWLTPDYDSDVTLPVNWSGDQASVIIPELRVSGLLVTAPK
jgi:hypothetical protein